MKKITRVLLVLALSTCLFASTTLYAVALDVEEGVDVTGVGEYQLTETEPAPGISNFAVGMQTFTFSGNIPAAPNYLRTSNKSVPLGATLQVLMNSTTGSKAVKMRVMGTRTEKALTGWKTVSAKKLTSLYTAVPATLVYLQLQSTSGAKMTAQGAWYF